MHKSADEERVCGRCGGLLLSAAERRKVARAAHSEDSNGKRVNSEQRRRRRAQRTLQMRHRQDRQKDESAEAIAIREALAYFDVPDPIVGPPRSTVTGRPESCR